ncbi:MAG: hypothetical protein A2W33_04560 [Chloroflexi bacterium RBG_16_52_11]|nr:MAG: hypothetical protein A2W33_04560 [Chloroflexi bacterium RBG_16_52_11]
MAAGTTERVSVASDESQGTNSSESPSISADRRYVAFRSDATNLVDGDTNGFKDIFVRDRVSGTTERVSVASDEGQGNDGSIGGAISADGRYVAFWSAASNLVVGDTNNFLDVFVRDRLLGTTERVSVASDGSQGNFDSIFPAISADGRYVAFRSHASTLVGGDTNNSDDVFVRDRQAGTTERVSVASDESQGNNGSYRLSISADGRYVAFDSDASNLVGLLDTNNWGDIFVRDREAGTTERVSVTSDEGQQNFGAIFPAISANGRYVVFVSYATNLVGGDTNGVGDIFVRNRVAGTTERVSVANDGTQGNGESGNPLIECECEPSISADGRYVAFGSEATNLVSEDGNGAPDIFIRDRLLRTTGRLSVGSDGSQANNGSGQPSISADGRYVAFRSIASNLVGDDTNGYLDVFVRDRGEQPPLLNVFLPVVAR